MKDVSLIVHFGKLRMNKILPHYCQFTARSVTSSSPYEQSKREYIIIINHLRFFKLSSSVFPKEIIINLLLSSFISCSFLISYIRKKEQKPINQRYVRRKGCWFCLCKDDEGCILFSFYSIHTLKYSEKYQRKWEKELEKKSYLFADLM